MSPRKKYDEYSLSDIFREIELNLIDSMKRNLSRHEKWEGELDYKWEQWQISKLRSIEKYRSTNRKVIKSYQNEVQSIIDTVLKQSYGEAYNNSIKLAEDVHLDIAGMDNSVSMNQLEIPEDGFFQINDSKLDAIIYEMQDMFSNQEGIIMRKMDDEYRHVMAKYIIQMGAGVTTHSKAVDNATDDFLKKGIDSVVYKDGKRVNIANYAEMYLRTASMRAAFIAQGAVRDKIQVFTVLVSQHANCCEHCLKWQNQVLIDDVYTSLANEKQRTEELSNQLGYDLLSTAMKEGLFHPNCRHSISTFFPGKSLIPKEYSQEENLKVTRNYNLEQEQRNLENKLRKWKRISKGTSDPQNKELSQRMVKKYQKDLRDHIKSNPNLRREYWRERTEQYLVDSPYPFNSDKQQYERYKLILREEDLPKSIQEFSAMKHLENKEYDLIKTKVRAMGYYNKALSREPELTSMIKNVAKDIGMEPVNLQFSTKSIDSYLRKVETNFNKGKINYEVKDINRYTLVSSGDTVTEKTLKSFDVLNQKGYNISEVKNYWIDRNDPYNGVNTTIRDAEGNPFEIQYHTPESFKVKEYDQHRLYEEFRLLSEKDKKGLKGRTLNDLMKTMSDPLKIPKNIEKVRK